MTKSSSRIQWIDWMKGASIMAVVLYHTNIMPEVKSLAYILCLPAFFFTAGMFADDQLSFIDYFRKKTLRLLVPYIAFGLLAWVAWLFIGRHYGADADAQVAWYQPLINMLYGTSDRMSHNAPLWFLTCLMVLEWLYFAVSRCRLSVAWQTAIIIVLALIGIVLGKRHIILPWGITAAMVMLPVYWVGKRLAPVLINKTSELSVRTLILLLVAGIAGLVAAHLFNPDIKISVAKVGNPLLFYIGVFAGIAVWFSLACLCTNQKSPILQLGGSTLWLLGLHMPFFGAVKGVALIGHVPLSFWSTTAGSLILWLTTIIVLGLGLIPVCRRALGSIRAYRKRVCPDTTQSPSSPNPSR